MSWLDALVFGVRVIFSEGVEKPLRSRLNFIGASVVDNAVDDRLDVTIGDALDENFMAANGPLLPGVVNVLGAAVTAVTMPLASTIAGRPVIAVKDNNANAVTITRAGADTIAGATVVTMTVDPYEMRTFIASKTLAKYYRAGPA